MKRHPVRTIVAHLKTRGLLHTLRIMRERLYIRYRESRLGIDTEAFVSLEDLGLEDPNRRYYVPVSYQSFPKILRALNADPQRDVFLDFGSGMGRAVILAALHPFRKIIGVELSPELSRVAERNVRNAFNRLRCRDVELVTSDAMTYRIPPEVTVV